MARPDGWPFCRNSMQMLPVCSHCQVSVLSSSFSSFAARRKGNPGGSVPPVAGPVVPLTGANIGLEQVLLGGPGESRGATVGLIAGKAVAAPSGRADDFGWPRGVVNIEPAAAEAIEPAAAEAAAPDTATATAGAGAQGPPAQVGDECLRRSSGPGAEASPAPAAASS